MIDLHTHSTSSDGFLSPKELLSIALKIKLEALALTDHDAVSGLKELHQAAKNKPIEIINGAEMSVYYPKTDMEIIAIDIPDKSLSAFADYQQKEISRREQLAQDRIVILQKAGYDISYDEVAYDHNGNKRIQIRRPHFTDILLKKGYIKDADEAYNKIFADGGICDISNKALSVDKMIRFIHENNAKAILAHPIHTLHTGKKLFQLLQKLKKLGLDGIEVFHSSQSQELRKEYLEMITELKMITTGGSDFHGGSAHPENKLGTGCENNLNIPYLVLEQLRKKRAPSKTYYNELKKYL